LQLRPGPAARRIEGAVLADESAGPVAVPADAGAVRHPPPDRRGLPAAVRRSDPIRSRLRADRRAADQPPDRGRCLLSAASGELAPRSDCSPGERYGPWAWRLAGSLPGWRAVIDRLRRHSESSARLASEAGCSARTVELIRNQAHPIDPDAGERLRLADEAS